MNVFFLEEDRAVLAVNFGDLLRACPESGLVADIIAHDSDGKIFTRVDGAEVTISAQLNRLFTPALANY